MDRLEIKRRFQENDVVCERVIHTFSLISNKTRFRILCLLAKGEFCVGDIVDTIQHSSLSNVCQQLKLLSLNGIVAKRREKKYVFYSLADPKIRQLIQQVESLYQVES